jgi:hypothetical protein
MKILFRCAPEFEELLPRPIPAKRGLPEWLKAMPMSAASELLGAEVRTVKHCPPFLDAMASGFLMPLACDVEVREGRFHWNWDLPSSALEGTRAPLSFHLNEQATGSPLFDPEALVIKFNNFWTIALEEGWSLLVTHPLNRADLPFQTLSGLVDCDRFGEGLIHFPAIWRDRDFAGRLPKGTPVAQCIPVPRESLDFGFETLSGEAAERYREIKNALGEEPGAYKTRYRAKKA